MPTKDEDGNIIGLDGFPIFLRDDDAREYVLPGSIPEVSELSADPEEYDCLPPLEHTGSWVLSANAVQSITEALQKLFPALFHGAAEAFEDLSRLCLSPRGYRKAVRWEEKNRRRRLKGLPEKPCPYQDRLLQIASDNWREKQNG